MVFFGGRGGARERVRMDIHVHITRYTAHGYTRTYYTIYTYILHDIHALPLLPKASDALAMLGNQAKPGKTRQTVYTGGKLFQETEWAEWAESLSVTG